MLPELISAIGRCSSGRLHPAMAAGGCPAARVTSFSVLLFSSAEQDPSGGLPAVVVVPAHQDVRSKHDHLVHRVNGITEEITAARLS